MWLTRVSIGNPYFATMLMAALVVLGLFSMLRLPVEKFPEVRFPVAVVQTGYLGASPSVVESEVTRPIEEAVNTVAGVKNIRSYSFEGSSVVIVEFLLTVDPMVAVQDVREKVSGIQGRFRREISTPTVSQFNPTDTPVMTLAVSSDRASLRELSTWAEHVLRKRVQSVQGVGEAALVGAVQREIRIEVNPDKLDAYGLDITALAEAVRRANQTFPAGRVQTHGQDIRVRLEGKVLQAVDFARLVVAWRGGAPVRMSDVARVFDGEQESESLALVNGQRALSLEIRATRGANIVAMSEGVLNTLEQIRTEAPHYQINVLQDTAEEVKKSLNTVRNTLIEGAMLTVLIVFIFLNSWRSTVITGLTLPIALIGTLFAVSVAGFTLNVMTLLALTLSIGLLIDDAIVVRENIVRHAGFGKSHYQAALDGTEEMGLAVLATTLTVVAVFLPVGFMGGILGLFFKQFGLTVVVAVLISLLVSFSLDPMLSSVWRDLPVAAHSRRGIGGYLQRFDGFMERTAERYAVAVAWVLGHRKTTLAIATVALLGSFMLVPWIGAEFMPKSDTGRFQLTFKTAAGTPLEYTESKARAVSDEIRREYGNQIEHIYVNIGGGFAGGRNQASIEVILRAREAREGTVFDGFERLRERIQRLAGLELVSLNVSGSAGGDSKPIRIGIRGADFAVLGKIADEIRAHIAALPDVADVESSLSDADPAISVQLNRDAAASLGVDVSSLGNALSVLLAGSVVTTWEAPDGENYDVKMQLPKVLRQESVLDLLNIAGRATADGVERVPLSAVAYFEPSKVPRQIERMNQQREVTVTGNILVGDSRQVMRQIEGILEAYAWPAGYRFDLGGENKDMQESFAYAVQALAMGVIFIYMILAAQFRSFTQPIVIMVSLPLAFVGVFLALWVWRSTLNMFSMIGIITLMGLAAKNGILLVDFVNQARRRGVALHDALTEAGRVRLRPILMTSLAMIFGMLPLALSHAEGAELNAPMAQAVIGGIVSSTLLTLFVVPVVYSYVEAVVARLRGRRGVC